ncbi:MAG: aldo/keto reductase [Candidatus Pacebacteria bacterium]|nr:aldo/keto reductase [Candidatus Paceibacterota bacterium]PIR59919.1 MAG: aldehyde oxidoreductase [Candidatus Pacebacteria bacterium CG10_big_fil_rev_8_21_14_0_10_44_54]
MTNPILLNNNKTIPALGLGTWRSEPGKVKAAVQTALNAGYRHIDCAAIYMNEPEIGEVFSTTFSDDKILREEVFITSKLWNSEHHPDAVEKACRKTLADLQLEYLDLYLIHWGIAFKPSEQKELLDENGMIMTIPVSIQETWRAMENLVEKGLVNSIGVANFTTMMLFDLLTYAKIQPAMNQVEIHPYNAQPELINFCHSNSVAVTAYSPLGSFGAEHNRPISDKTILSLAKAHQKSPAQVLIRWSLQRGLVVIPKSTNPDRIVENAKVFDFELSDDEMMQINKLNKNYRFVDPSKRWGLGYFN